MFVVGLTGGIGAGKTAVSDWMAARGVQVIDTDCIARALTAPGGEAMPDIRAVFGDAVFDAAGMLDRRALRLRVFADATARSKLEAILHPRIEAAVEARLAEAEGVPYVLLVVPLLAETGCCRSRMHHVLTVEAPLEARIERVMRRSQLTRVEVEAILAAQADDAVRQRIADAVVHNDGDLAALEQKLACLHEKVLALARAGF